jgi:predicted RNase H-like HicB family nuclease
MEKRKYVVVVEKDEDDVYIGSVPSLPGCHSYGETLDELMKNMKEAIELCLEVLESEKQEIPMETFVGTQEIEILA